MRSTRSSGTTPTLPDNPGNRTSVSSSSNSNATSGNNKRTRKSSDAKPFEEAPTLKFRSSSSSPNRPGRPSLKTAQVAEPKPVIVPSSGTTPLPMKRGKSETKIKEEKVEEEVEKKSNSSDDEVTFNNSNVKDNEDNMSINPSEATEADPFENELVINEEEVEDQLDKVIDNLSKTVKILFHGLSKMDLNLIERVKYLHPCLSPEKVSSYVFSNFVFLAFKTKDSLDEYLKRIEEGKEGDVKATKYCSGCAFVTDTNLASHIKTCLSDGNRELNRVFRLGFKTFPDFTRYTEGTVLLVKFPQSLQEEEIRDLVLTDPSIQEIFVANAFFVRFVTFELAKAASEQLHKFSNHGIKDGQALEASLMQVSVVKNNAKRSLNKASPSKMLLAKMILENKEWTLTDPDEAKKTLLTLGTFLKTANRLSISKNFLGRVNCLLNCQRFVPGDFKKNDASMYGIAFYKTEEQRNKAFEECQFTYFLNEKVHAVPMELFLEICLPKSEFAGKLMAEKLVKEKWKKSEKEKMTCADSPVTQSTVQKASPQISKKLEEQPPLEKASSSATSSNSLLSAISVGKEKISDEQFLAIDRALAIQTGQISEQESTEKKKFCVSKDDDKETSNYKKEEKKSFNLQEAIEMEMNGEGEEDQQGKDKKSDEHVTNSFISNVPILEVRDEVVEDHDDNDFKDELVTVKLEVQQSSDQEEEKPLKKPRGRKRKLSLTTMQKNSKKKKKNEEKNNKQPSPRGRPKSVVKDGDNKQLKIDKNNRNKNNKSAEKDEKLPSELQELEQKIKRKKRELENFYLPSFRVKLDLLDEKILNPFDFKVLQNMKENKQAMSSSSNTVNVEATKTEGESEQKVKELQKQVEKLKESLATVNSTWSAKFAKSVSTAAQQLVKDRGGAEESSKIKELTRTIQEQQKTAMENQRKFNGMNRRAEEEISAIKNKMEVNVKKSNYLEGTNNDLKIQVESGDKKIKELERNNSELKSSFQTKIFKLIELEKQNSELKNKIENGDKRLKDLEKYNSELKSLVKVKENEIANQKQAGEMSKNVGKELESTNAELRRQIDNLQAKPKDTNVSNVFFYKLEEENKGEDVNKNKEIEKANIELTKQVEEMARKVKAHSFETEQTVKANKILRDKLMDRHAEISKLKEELLKQNSSKSGKVVEQQQETTPIPPSQSGGSIIKSNIYNKGEEDEEELESFSLKKKVEELKSQVEELGKKRTEEETKSTVLRDKLTRYLQDIVNKNKKISEVSCEKMNLDTALKGKEREQKFLKESNEKLEKEKNQLNDEVKEARVKLNSTSEQLETAKSTIKTLSYEVTMQKEINAGQREQVEFLQNNAKEIQAELDINKKSNNDLNERIILLEQALARMNNFEKKNSELLITVKELKELNNTLQMRNKGLKESLDSSKKTLTTVQTSVNYQNTKEFLVQQEELTKTKSLLANMSALLEENSKKYTFAEKEKEVCKRRLEVMEKQCEDFRIKLSLSEDRNKNLQHHVVTLQSKVTAGEEKLKHLSHLQQPPQLKPQQQLHQAANQTILSKTPSTSPSYSNRSMPPALTKMPSVSPTVAQSPSQRLQTPSLAQMTPMVPRQEVARITPPMHPMIPTPKEPEIVQRPATMADLTGEDKLLCEEIYDGLREALESQENHNRDRDPNELAEIYNTLFNNLIQLDPRFPTKQHLVKLMLDRFFQEAFAQLPVGVSPVRFEGRRNF